MARDEGKPTPPPADLNTRNLHLAKFSFADWRRIDLAAHSASFYSPNPKNRFSSPSCPVLYVGDKVVTTLWKTFWDDLGTVPEDRRILPENKRRLEAAWPHVSLTLVRADRAVKPRATEVAPRSGEPVQSRLGSTTDLGEPTTAINIRRGSEAAKIILTHS